MEKKKLKKNARVELERLYHQIGLVLSSDDNGNANLNSLIPAIWLFCQHYLWCNVPFKSLLKDI